MDKISNSILTVEISEHGAEILSIKKKQVLFASHLRISLRPLL